MPKSHAYRFRNAVRALSLLVGAAVVTSCGGGGYGSGKNSNPTVTIAVQPATIALGQSATLTWSANTGISCTASGAWTGVKPSSGTQVVTPDAVGTASFTVSCGGGAYGGQANATAVLTVTAQSAFSNTTLVADSAAALALTTDPNLLNPWGIAFGPGTPLWVADNRSEAATVYDGSGTPLPAAAPLVVDLPASAQGTPFQPTGVVFNGGNEFLLTEAGHSAPARFIFAGEGGMIAGWSADVNSNRTVTMYVDDDSAVYKGLAIANNGAGDFLYATDFHNNKVDVFDAAFRKQAATADSFAFVDPDLPDGYAPFGIQAIANGAGGAAQLYVSYAQQEAPDNFDNANGAGLGLVDIFDTNGRFVKRLIPTGGRLDAPWGMALAPAEFGTLGHTLLVGNVGDGRINAFDPVTGAFVGTVADAEGTPFAMPGVWGIAFGNNAANRPRNTLFYAAGTHDEANGAYGRIDLGATPPILNAPPFVAITGPNGNASGTVTLTATVTAEVAVATVEFFADDRTSLGVASSAPYSIQWDTTQMPNGPVQITATARDVDGNVGTSSAVTVTVANDAATATSSRRLP